MALTNAEKQARWRQSRRDARSRSASNHDPIGTTQPQLLAPVLVRMLAGVALSKADPRTRIQAARVALEHLRWRHEQDNAPEELLKRALGGDEETLKAWLRSMLERLEAPTAFENEQLEPADWRDVLADTSCSPAHQNTPPSVAPEIRETRNTPSGQSVG